MEAEQLIERQIRRDIQYRLILRLILRQNTVHLCTSRQPADGHPKGSARQWRTSMEPENVNVKCAHEPRPKQKLLDRAREIIRLKHYSIRTERAYLNWMRRYILFHHKRHPQEMGPAEIEAFLTHLAIAGHVARSTQSAPPAISTRLSCSGLCCGVLAGAGSTGPEDLRQAREQYQ